VITDIAPAYFTGSDIRVRDDDAPLVNPSSYTQNQKPKNQKPKTKNQEKKPTPYALPPKPQPQDPKTYT